MKTNLKVVYGCYPSYVSLYVLNLLLEKHKVPVHTILISTKEIVIKGQKISGMKGLKFFLRSFGWKYAFYQLMLSTLLPALAQVRGFFIPKNRLLSFKQLAKKHNIPLVYTADFNAPYLVEKIALSQPDVFLSMGLDQILKQDLINVFDKLCVNMHASKLPDFRGPDAVFHFLLSPETEMGLTLHEIVPQLDAGNIICTQMIPRAKNASHFSLLKKSIELACTQFHQLLNFIPVASKPQPETIKYPYRSWPSPSEIGAFESQNEYFYWNEILTSLSIKSSASKVLVRVEEGVS